MNRRKAVTLTLAIFALAAIALPSAALARVAYYTGYGIIGPEEFGPYVNQANLAAGTIGPNPLRILSEGPPPDVAITPDGVTAYPTGTFDQLMGVDVASEGEATPVEMSGGPWWIAIAPNGTRAYTANGFEGTVSVLDLATHEEVTSISLSGNANGIAVTPDGTRAYVSLVGPEEVAVIDLATNTEIGSIPVGEEPQGIAVTPDGKHVYVVNSGDETVSEIDVATNTVVATIPTAGPGGENTQIAIAPNGLMAYVIGATRGGQAESWVIPIDLATGTAGAPVTELGYFLDIAILPDGSRAYITYEEEELPQVASLAVGSGLVGNGFGEGIIPFNLATNTLEPGFDTRESPEALAIVPNQGPRAAISGPDSGNTGADLSFSGSGSSDSDGTVARYDWDFGDGSSAANGGPAVNHAYAQAGTYQVTLTTTDNEGCSTAQVFTGQTMYCNGSGLARTTHQVVVTSPSAPPKTIARCKQVSGRATSFKPRIRPGHVVPGVRVRLAVPTPSRLDVKARLQWSVAGKKGSAKLEAVSVSVKHWRRIRFAIPDQLRNLLPLGTPVTLELTIKTTPHNGAACAATLVHKTLHVHVVKVFPNAVQSKRPR